MMEWMNSPEYQEEDERQRMLDEEQQWYEQHSDSPLNRIRRQETAMLREESLQSPSRSGGYTSYRDMLFTVSISEDLMETSSKVPGRLGDWATAHSAMGVKAHRINRSLMLLTYEQGKKHVWVTGGLQITLEERI